MTGGRKTVKKTVRTEIFAKRLNELMKANNETVYTIAEKLSLSSGTISRYMNCVISPKITTVESLARLFKVDTMWLLGYDVEKGSINTTDKFDALTRESGIKNFGQRLKQARKNKNLTQKELSEKVGVSKSSIGGYELGVNSPTDSVLVKLFEVLEVEPNYLFQDSFDQCIETKEIMNRLDMLTGAQKKLLISMMDQLIGRE